MTRTERQKKAVKVWLDNKGKGTWEFPTGFGKTFTAIIALKAVLKKYPNVRILIVVPTTTLKDQWIESLNNNDIVFGFEVQVINTVVKHSWDCDLLCIDEIHRVASNLFRQVFECVKYKLILGLTATFDRLDGKQQLISKYCPIIDRVSLLECQANGWISQYREYQVLLNVDNIEEYNRYNREWVEHYEFFQFDFGKAMSCIGPDGWKNKLRYRDELYSGNDEDRKKQILQSINYHAMGFIRTMQKRKAFINNHPKKIEIAKRIMEMRPNAKIITFSNNVQMAEALENSNYVYTGKTSKKKGRVMIEDFISGKINHLHSCMRLNEGFDVPDASVGIILGTDSSETKARQRRGRVIRKYENKKAEIFYLIINNTIELKWYKNSHKNDVDYLTIDENGLEQVLKGEKPDLYNKKTKEFVFRY